MSSFPPIPIRGPQDLNQPFIVCCYSSSQKIMYLLTEIEYTDESSHTIQEVVLNPCFAGNFAYPYTSSLPNKEGQEIFLVYAYGNGTPTTGVTSYLPNYSSLATPLPVSSIQPFIGLYNTPPSGGAAAGMILKQYVGVSGLTPKYLTLDLPPDSQSPKQYLARTVLGSDSSTATVFNIGGGNNFFVKNNNVYAGYPYKLAAANLPGGTTTPFRNFNAYSLLNGNDSNYRITTYNTLVRDPRPPKYYLGTTDVTANWLYPLLGTPLTTTTPSGTTVVPTFQGQVIGSPSGPANFDKVGNLPYGDLTYFFVPLTYFPSNFTVNGVDPSTGDGKCFLITASSAPDVTIILNYLYYAWVSGYPPPTRTGDNYQYPIVNQSPGFIPAGKGALNLAGWTTAGECNKEYYYDYCGVSDYCGKCYGGCNASGKPFCDDNPNFTQLTQSTGLPPFECEASQTPPPAFNWWWVWGFLLALVLFIVGAIVIAAITFKKSRDNPRNDIIKSLTQQSPSVNSENY